MKTIFISLLLIATTIAHCAPSLTQKIDALLNEQHFQGAVLIAKNNQILFCKGFGLANAEHHISNTPDTVFRIGSITKSFTAIAILQLQEKGLLNVDDPINKYLPGYPQGEKITIHHLLSHTSGIAEIMEVPNYDEIKRNPTTPLKAIELFKNLPLKFSPGTSCEYSNSNYIILGAIIESITKKSYEDVIKANILQPLGMNATYYAHNEQLIPKRASGYSRQLQNATYIDMSLPHASGALASTVKDLYKLDQGLSKLLKNPKVLFTIHGCNPAEKLAYGYGFRIGPVNRNMEECRPSILGHFGSIEGFEAAFIKDPDEDLTIILLSNVENAPVRSLHKRLASLIYQNRH